MKRFLLVLMFLFSATSVRAQLKEYDHAYDIDLKEEIPLVWRLEKEYRKVNDDYDWKYDYNWRLPSAFNYKFKQNIKDFGSIEKRFESADEEDILNDLRHIPKAYYPYIGPMLHNIPGLSGKVLDLPGIKETKNKFPDKIASRFKDMPDIEFASPELYIFISPYFWGEDLQSLEYPQIYDQQPEYLPNIRISPKFITYLHNKVNIDNYFNGNNPPQPSMGVRNYYATKETPLSGADVRAFIESLAELKKFRLQKDYEIRLMMLDSIIQYWDEKKGINSQVAYYKNVVNPCQSIARKVKWAGLQNEFQKYIGKQAFGVDDWAYTCDKVIKAYRLASMPRAFVASLRLAKHGYFYSNPPQDYTEKEKEQLRNYLEALIRMYETNQDDVDTVRPFFYELQEKLVDLDTAFLGTPIILP